MKKMALDWVCVSYPPEDTSQVFTSIATNSRVLALYIDPKPLIGEEL